MRLVIAEKPSLARAIAAVLPGPMRVHKTHIVCADWVVAWCAGHILETAPPEAYRPEYKRWRVDDLPIVPERWKHVVRVPELLDTIRKLLPEAERVVHAGDPDREGQLLVDEVLTHLGHHGPVDRLLVSDLRPEAIALALRSLEPNTKHRPLSEAALARQRADWLYGLNLSRLYTLLGQAGGYGGVLSVGRVQTPLLGLLVRRDRAIADFRPSAYFTVSADVRPSAAPASDPAATFRVHWVPGPACEPHLDEDKRLLRREIAEEVLRRVETARSGRVTARKQEERTQSPPLPYALADLQMDAGKRLGLSAKAVLDACQSLYETHKLLTYPRSDCAHLPEGHFAQAREVLAAIAAHAPALRAATRKADTGRRSKAWNDKKVTAHHGIVPTPSAAAPTPALSAVERAIYELVARRYMGQFFLAHAYQHTELDLAIAGETFRATGCQVTTVGWKSLWTGVAYGESAARPEDATMLPALTQVDEVLVQAARVTDKRTEPPKAFTDATLMAAMCGVAKHVSDPRVRQILTETDGIGTAATRAAIIETLFARGYAVRQGKSILSTDTGRALIAALPEVATTPDMTAVWEAAMRAITEERQSLSAFLTCIVSEIGALVASGRKLGSIRVPESAGRHATSPPPHPSPPPSRRSSRPRRAAGGPRP